MNTFYIANVPPDGRKSYEAFTYPAGELQVRIPDAEADLMKAADRIQVVARIQTHHHLISLGLFLNAIRYVTGPTVERVLILPYLPYSRADRRFVAGDCYGLQVFGDILSSFAYSYAVTLDVHSERSFLHVRSLVSISPDPLITAAWSEIPGQKTAVILPDEGALRYSFAEGTPVFRCSKIRDPKTGELSGFEVPQELREYPQGLIIDDICDGGRTFIGIADQLVGMDLHLYVSHGIFSMGTEELNKRFKRIFTSDSFTRGLGSEFPGVTRISALPLLLEV